MTKTEIANILKKCRCDAGLTQKEAATKLGRPQQTLASWETGKSQPDANTLFQLCDLYGVSVDYAFGYSHHPLYDKETPAAETSDGRAEEFVQLYSQLSNDEKKLVIAQIKGILANRE